MWDKIKLVLKNILEIGLYAVATLAVVQILCGGVIPGIKINITGAIAGFGGNAGFMNLVILVLIVWIIKKK